MERDKFLAKEMGLHWYDVQEEAYRQRRRNTDFSTWRGFGKLMQFMDNEFSDEEIADMLYRCAKDGCVTNLPNKVANAVYEFLKGRE